MTMDNLIEQAMEITSLRKDVATLTEMVRLKDEILARRNNEIAQLKARLREYEEREAIYIGRKNLVENQRKEIKRLKAALKGVG